MERELLLLGALRQQAMHGYQLHEFIERALASCTDLKKPTAYMLLDKMAAAGWVMQKETRSGKRPPRRVYRLTPAGEAKFQELLRANLARHAAARFGGDIGLAFLDAIKPAEALDLLARRRAALAGALQAANAAPPHEGSLQFIVEHQQRHLAVELDWLDEVMARLAKKPKRASAR